MRVAPSSLYRVTSALKHECICPAAGGQERGRGYRYCHRSPYLHAPDLCDFGAVVDPRRSRNSGEGEGSRGCRGPSMQRSG